MAINPFAQPINYSAQFVDLTPAFRAAGEGFRAIGEGIQEREKQEQTMTLKAQYATDLQNALNNPTQKTWSQMIAKYPQQREAFADARKGFSETALANEFNQGFEVSTALENKRPEVAKERLQTFITARKNSNLPTGIYEDALEALERDDVLGAQANVNSALAMADPDRFQKQVEARIKASTALSVISEAVSKAEQAKEQFKVLTPAQVKALGLPPGTYQQGPTGEIKTVVKEPLVSVSVGQQGQRDTLALKELDIPRAQEFSAAAASARTLARDAKVISNLLKGKGGGAVIKLGADIAKNFGFTTDTVVASDLANSLAIRGATQMRPPGSGSTSDIEFKAFVSAFPSLANSEGGRELMAKYADAFAKRTAKIADHARKLIRADNYSEEEIARFDESLGPILDADFYDLSKQGRRANVPVYTPRAAPVTPAAPAAAPAVSPAATAPRTVDSVLQQYLRRQ